MSTENKKMRRNYSFVYRFIILVVALIIVFFLSFFVTLSIKTPHPIDFIRNEFFEEKSADKIIADYENEKNAERQTDRNSDKDSDRSTEKNSDRSSERNSERSVETKSDREAETKSEQRAKLIEKSTKKIDASTISGRIERIQSIKQAVNEKVQNKEHYLKLDEIPRALRQAIIAVEDSRFYSHGGFDIGGIARATITNVEAGQIEEGGSTITQQLVKNLFLTQEQSFTRKIEELLLAQSMERDFTKDQILELYLNTIYFGSGFYGIYDAAVGYFGVEPKDLTLAECAMLAGLPNAPSLYSPYVDFMLAKKRQIIVIDAMVKANILTPSEAEKAKIETLTLAKE